MEYPIEVESLAKLHRDALTTGVKLGRREFARELLAKMKALAPAWAEDEGASIPLVQVSEYVYQLRKACLHELAD